jgi:hypothetical protein
MYHDESAYLRVSPKVTLSQALTHYKCLSLSDSKQGLTTPNMGLMGGGMVTPAQERG